jgi:putative ABC transport system permease protein
MNSISKIKIAARNIVKNKRRSLVTLTAVIIGFISLSLFEGYFTYIYHILEKQAIVGERLGHLIITRQGFYDQDGENPQNFLFDQASVKSAQDVLVKNPAITLVSPRLQVNGLVSNGDVSRIFLGEGISAEDLIALRGEEFAELPGSLSIEDQYAATFGARLGELLGLAKGDSATLLTSTSSGMVNAVDATVGELANTGSVGTNDKFILLPLGLAQRLYDFEGADRLSIVLTDGADIEQQKKFIMDILTESGFSVEIKDWKELSVYYGQVKSLFDMMYLFITIVVLIVVIASVANTMGMAISERTREIGTLRAIGMKRSTISSLFVWEGVFIVFVGCAIGILATYIFGSIINNANITYVPPDASAEAELIVTLLFENMFGSLVVLTIFAAIASYFPAKRAAKRPIVEALSHV